MEEEAEITTKHTRLLQKIREEKERMLQQEKDDNDEYQPSRGYGAIGEEDTFGDSYSLEGSTRGTTNGTQGSAKDERTASGPGSGSGPIDAKDLNALTGYDSLAGTEKGRQRELKRQAAQRARDAKKELEVDGTPRPRFQLKGLLARSQVPSKTFTKKEAEDSLEKLAVVYSQGSHLLDEILEVITKDHEQVSIWQLDPDESNMLATLHVERAQHDPQAAKSARVLLSLFDKVYVISITWPRVVLSSRYVKQHKGLSLW